MAEDEEVREIRTQEERREGGAQREARKAARIKREASKKALQARCALTTSALSPRPCA